jgi:hypothetical protein
MTGLILMPAFGSVAEFKPATGKETVTIRKIGNLRNQALQLAFMSVQDGFSLKASVFMRKWAT